MRQKQFMISVGPDKIEDFEKRVARYNLENPDQVVTLSKRFSFNEIYSSWIITVKGFKDWAEVYYFGKYIARYEILSE